MTAPEPYTPEVGHRVRGTVEGVVLDEDAARRVQIGERWYWSSGLTWERLPDPEPEWQPGDVVRDAEGDVFVSLGSKRWRALGWNGPVDDYVPVRPLTRLVPEAQP